MKGFVFGKFLPFHKGHEAMIKFALTKCDFLTVIVCSSEHDSSFIGARELWISQTFESIPNIEVITLNYLESELPNTSVSSVSVSKLWSEKFKSLLPDYDLVITSEEYGDYVANFMGIKHIPFDIDRKLYPISGTQIREDFTAHWNFLPNSVKDFLSFKVVILGTECTGKTTLTNRIADHFNCSRVVEVGRELIPDSNLFTKDDLELVVSEHAKRIQEAMHGDSPRVIIDTDLHITQSYSKFILGEWLDIDESIYRINRADLYLYLNNDVKYVQDGTRLSESDRNLLDISHRNVLNRCQINFVEITGNWDERFEKSIKAITNFNFQI